MQEPNILLKNELVTWASTNAPDQQLSRSQLLVLRTRLAPYLTRLQDQQQQLGMTGKIINDITGAYLAGLGLPTESNVDLATGILTPVESADG